MRGNHSRCLLSRLLRYIQQHINPRKTANSLLLADTVTPGTVTNRGCLSGLSGSLTSALSDPSLRVHYVPRGQNCISRLRNRRRQYRCGLGVGHDDVGGGFSSSSVRVQAGSSFETACATLATLRTLSRLACHWRRHRLVQGSKWGLVQQVMNIYRSPSPISHQRGKPDKLCEGHPHHASTQHTRLDVLVPYLLNRHRPPSAQLLNLLCISPLPPLPPLS
jgi:hypothetical protein